MAGNIYHRWDGTTLTITSDSGTSSMNLKGQTGAQGPRGPQGPAGTITNSDGSIDLTGYATEAYVEQKLEVVDLVNYYKKPEADALFLVDEDIEGLASETFVTTKIAEAKLSGDLNGIVDLSVYAKKDDLNIYATKDDLNIYAVKDDLNIYAVKDDLTAYRKTDNTTFDNYVKVQGESGNMYVYANGIQGDDSSLWIGGDGEGVFSSLTVGGKTVATEEYVASLVAQKINEAFAEFSDGDEEEY